VRQGDENVVVHLHPGSAPIQLGVYVGHGPEEQESLVDQMTAEVV
jgi:hypothetical protein